MRDVDLDCTQLNINDGKMEKSNEPRVIPKKLQPYVRQLVEARDPFEPLFKTSYTESGHHTRRWLEALDTFCHKAGVPYFCPHTLKGVSGATFRHYAEKGLVEATQAPAVFVLFNENWCNGLVPVDAVSPAEPAPFRCSAGTSIG